MDQETKALLEAIANHFQRRSQEETGRALDVGQGNAFVLAVGESIAYRDAARWVRGIIESDAQRQPMGPLELFARELPKPEPTPEQRMAEHRANWGFMDPPPDAESEEE